MKKTLAILLALLAAASITLASCEKDPVDTGDGWDDDNDYIDTKDENDDTDGTKDTSDETDDKETESDNTTVPSGWTEATGNIYLGMNVILRSAPNDLASSKTDTKLTFGTALTRVRTSTNGKWVEVKYNDTLYYVKSVYTTDNGNNFTFTADEEKPALTINPKTDYNVCFYKTPFFCDDSEANYGNMLCKSGIKATHLSEGYTLKKLAVSANGKWIKVEFVGTVTISSSNSATYTAENPGVFYIQALSFTRGDVIGGGIVSGDNNSGDGDFVD